MKRSRSIFLLIILLVATNVVAQDSAARPSLPQRYLGYSGKSALNIVNLGYTYDIKDKMHLLELGIVSFRYKWVGMSLLNFEMGLIKDDSGRPALAQWVGYKPSIQFYAPIAKSLAISPYFGASIDCSYLGKYLIKDYSYDKSANFFVDLIGGLSFYMTLVPQVPLELRAEYRYPVVQNTMNALSQGFYVSAHLYFSKVFGRDR